MTSIQKPIIDKRIYKYIKLKNGIKTLLVSDPETEKSGIALNVNVGSFSDPKDFPGLAHFLEHMLFMGTEKFPDENYFELKLNEWGGSYNAYTDSERTVYFLELFNENYQEIVDIFSRFFIDPLMKKDSVGREINAVDSENNKNLESDYWRVDQLIRSFSNPNSPFHKFGTGNLSTLSKPKIREELLKFHEKYYSSNIMELVMISNKDINEIEKMAEDYFKDVKNKNVTINYNYNQLPFDEEFPINRSFLVKSVQDKDTLLLLWQLPNQSKNYKKKSLQIISSLLGDENKNSILYSLKEQGLVNSLFSGEYDQEYNYCLYSLRLSLSNQGLNEIDYIISVIYKYIDILLNMETWQRFGDEYKKIGKINFDYQEKDDVSNYCTNLVVNMEKYKTDDVLSGPYLIDEIDGNNIRELLTYFRRDNMMTLIGKNNLEDKRKPMKEKYYGTKYLTIPNPKVINTDDISLILPPLNNYIPTNLKLLKGKSQDKLKEVFRDDKIEIWNCFNTQFSQPLDIYWIQIISPEFNKSTKNFLMTSIIKDLWIDYLTPLLYNAIETGYEYILSFVPYNNSIIIEIKGFSQNISLIMKDIMTTINNFHDKFDKVKFKLAKDKLEKHLGNIPLLPPWQLVTYYLESEWIEGFRDFNTLLKSIEDVTFNDIKEFYPSLMQKTYIKCVNGGNLKNTDLLNMEPFVAKSPLKDFDSLAKINPKYGEYIYYNKNKEDINEAIGIFYNIGEYSFSKIAKMIMYITIAREPFFDQLRTKEQLGYLVRCANHNFLNNYGVLQQIQSSVKDCDYLEKRIETFNKDFHKELKGITDEAFNTYKETVINMIMEKDENISELVNRLIKEVFLERYIFNRKEKMKKAVSKLIKEDIYKFSKKYIRGNKEIIIIKNKKSKQNKN